jgi:biofilm PGA synthesis N-glycosyltransferase PgaC
VSSPLGPEVSFVVIAHNEHQHAPVTLRSILEQRTAVPFEVVFIDDASTDGTANVVAAGSQGDTRVRVIRLPVNVGRGAARAAGIDGARANMIAFVDSDVTLPPDWLARCLVELPGNAAVGGVAVPDGDVAVIARISHAIPRGVPPRMPIAGSNVLFDASVLREITFDPKDRLGEDFRLAARLLREGHRLRRVPELEVRHEESKSYGEALRWRFANGVDAATHPREFGLFRLADATWLLCAAAWLIGFVTAVVLSPWWLLLGPVATAAAALLHAAHRFDLQPFRAFVLAWLANIPLMGAYVLGRTVGLPRLFAGKHG